MGRRQVYASATERKRAQRRRQRAAVLQSPCPATERLIALQEETAHLHLVERFNVPLLQQQATAEQLQLQQEHKERDMLDALFVLQTLIADFGYAEVERCVLQHLRLP